MISSRNSYGTTAMGAFSLNFHNFATLLPQFRLPLHFSRTAIMAEDGPSGGAGKRRRVSLDADEEDRGSSKQGRVSDELEVNHACFLILASSQCFVLAICSDSLSRATGSHGSSG